MSASSLMNSPEENAFCAFFFLYAIMKTMKEMICIGKIINTHGLKGEVKIRSYSDFDAERYAKGNTVYIQSEGEYLPFVTATFRMHKGYPLVSFLNYQDINLIEKYRDCSVFIDRNTRKPLKKGEYYRDELVGLKAVDEDDQEIGEVTAVEETFGAQNNLRISRKGDNDVLVPYIPEFIRKVDLDQRRIVIHVEEGLL